MGIAKISLFLPQHPSLAIIKREWREKWMRMLLMGSGMREAWPGGAQPSPAPSLNPTSLAINFQFPLLLLLLLVQFFLLIFAAAAPDDNDHDDGCWSGKPK